MSAPHFTDTFGRRLPKQRPWRDEPISDEARQAIIEHNRTMKHQRAFAAENRERIDAEWDALPSPLLRAEQHIASARGGMGEERWAELQAEWNDAPESPPS